MSKERGVEIQTRRGDVPKEIFEGLDEQGRQFVRKTFFWQEIKHPKTIICCALNVPDPVVYALVCPVDVAQNLRLLRSENGDLIVEHQRGETITLGNPETGGITPGAGSNFHLIDMRGVHIEREYSRLKARGLLADPLGESAGVPVVAVGLNYHPGLGFTLYKIIDVFMDRVSPTKEGTALTGLCVNLVKGR